MLLRRHQRRPGGPGGRQSHHRLHCARAPQAGGRLAQGRRAAAAEQPRH
uniref:Uncharacterized protein n=1 Tax=Macrostomum lignano TaxID=282301 RepID=A0A1I8FR19_9PLAT